MNTPEFIPENLKAARLLLKLSQAELGEAAGMNQKDISLHETKTTKTLIPLRYILALLERGIDINSLFRRGAVRMLPRADQPSVAQLGMERATALERRLHGVAAMERSLAAEPQATYGQPSAEEMWRLLRTLLSEVEELKRQR